MSDEKPLSKAAFSRYVAEVRVVDHLDYRSYLLALYQHIKSQEQVYTYFKFSENLGLGYCTTSHLITMGKRRLTVKAAEKMSKHMNLRNEDRRYFMALVAYAQSPDPTQKSKAFHRIRRIKNEAVSTAEERLQLRFFSEWYHSVVLELLSIPHVSQDPETLAGLVRPRVAPGKIDESKQLLLELGLLTHDESTGLLRPAQTHLRTAPDVAGLSVLSYHHQMLGLAKDALSTMAAEERDVTSVMVSASAERFEEIKHEILTFRRRIAELCESDPPVTRDRVLQLNLQLFPVTQQVSEKQRLSDEWESHEAKGPGGDETL